MGGGKRDCCSKIDGHSYTVAMQMPLGYREAQKSAVQDTALPTVKRCSVPHLNQLQWLPLERKHRVPSWAFGKAGRRGRGGRGNEKVLGVRGSMIGREEGLLPHRMQETRLGYLEF